MGQDVTLSKRMQMNGELVPRDASVADIGCDHGYVSIFLAEHRACKKVIATDVNEGPLAIARRNIREAGLANKIECRISDGMSALEPGEVDTLLIAGMGGLLVCRILEQSPQILKEIQTLVVQAQSDLAEVRTLLWQLGFCIQEECCCVDAEKYYVAIRAVRGTEKTPYTKEECTYGRLLPMKKDAVYFQYLMREKEKRDRLCQKLEDSDKERTKKRREELREESDGIVRILGGYYGKDYMGKGNDHMPGWHDLI